MSSGVSPGFAWLGGKNRMRDRIVPYTCGASLYVEPFAGALNVLLGRTARGTEVINDLDHRVVNFYRVLQNDAMRGQLLKKLKYTPYARMEFGRALEILENAGLHPAGALPAGDVDKAWAFFVAQNQGISGNGCNATNANNWGISTETDPVLRFRGHVAKLERLAERLLDVVIEHRDALALIRTWDRPHALFYCDPPYVPDTRKMQSGHARYREEMTLEHHQALIDALLSIQGQAILSGYRAPVVHDRLENAGWKRMEYRTRLYAAPRSKSELRTECLWLSPNLHLPQITLFN